MTESPRPSGESAAGLPGRGDLLRSLRRAVRASGMPWAWQGAPGAVDRWLADRGPGDLDLWCSGDDAGATRALLGELDAVLGARVAYACDPRRLRHSSWACETPDGLAVIDLTVGDLAVGPLTLLSADSVTTVMACAPQPESPQDQDPVLTGPAAVADLLVRRLLRGGVPDPDRLDAARRAWRGCSGPERDAVLLMLERVLGGQGAREALAALRGGPLDVAVARRARRRLLLATLAPAGLPAAWGQRRTVLPAGPLAGPVNLRRRGVVVVLVGTDGAGKSTVAESLVGRLHQLGLPTAQAYFGMARGNLPGVALARRVLGVGSTEPPAKHAATESGPGDPGGTGTGQLDHPTLRRVAAWYYAGEYLTRWLTRVAPHLVRGRVVVVDRWVWDLRESPWPDSRASRWLETVMPRPDIAALADAPAEIIHARKPERTLADQARQQEVFKGILAARPAACAEILVDTSGRTSDANRELVASVVGAAHLRRRLRS